MSSKNVIYKVSRPYNPAGSIEVYTEPNLDGMGVYEWRIIEDGKVVESSKGMGYGTPEVALRDALIVDTR